VNDDELPHSRADELDRALEALAGHRAPPDLGVRIVARARRTPQPPPPATRLWTWLVGPELRPGWQPALLGLVMLLAPLTAGYLAGTGTAGARAQSELESLAVELTWSAFELPATEIDLEP